MAARFTLPANRGRTGSRHVAGLAAGVLLGVVAAGCAGDLLDAMERGVRVGREQCAPGSRPGAPPAPVAAQTRREGCAEPTVDALLAMVRETFPDIAFTIARPGVVSARVRGRHGEFGVDAVVHERERVVLLVASDMGTVGRAIADDVHALALFSALARMNYDLLVGKYQVSPRTGEVLYSQEIYAEDGLCPRTLAAALGTLLQTVDTRRPEIDALLRSGI